VARLPRADDYVLLRAQTGTEGDVKSAETAADVIKAPGRGPGYAVDLMDYNSLQVTIVPEQAMKELGIGRGTFYRWLGVILRKGYMEKIATNVYRLKPYTAIKGQMKRVPDLGFFERQ